MFTIILKPTEYKGIEFRHCEANPYKNIKVVGKDKLKFIKEKIYLKKNAICDEYERCSKRTVVTEVSVMH